MSVAFRCVDKMISPVLGVMFTKLGIKGFGVMGGWSDKTYTFHALVERGGSTHMALFSKTPSGTFQVGIE